VRVGRDAGQFSSRGGFDGAALAFGQRLEPAAVDQFERPHVGILIHPAARLAHRRLDRAGQVRTH
jgi:hypothetical protein